MSGRLPVILTLVSVSGCSPVRVDTTAYLGDLPFPSPSPDVKIYVEANAADEPALLAREVTQSVRRELRDRGYACVADPDSADYVLACMFGVDRGHIVTRAVPRNSGYSARTSIWGFGGYIGRTHTHGSVTTYTEESYRQFDRWLLLTLIDRPTFDEVGDDNADAAIVWQASAVSTGGSRDLRSIVRYLLAAAFEHFGEDTGRQRRHSYSQDSDQADRFDPHTD